MLAKWKMFTLFLFIPIFFCIQTRFWWSIKTHFNLLQFFYLLCLLLLFCITHTHFACASVVCIALVERTCALNVYRVFNTFIMCVYDKNHIKTISKWNEWTAFKSEIKNNNRKNSEYVPVYVECLLSMYVCLPWYLFKFVEIETKFLYIFFFFHSNI